MIKYILRFLFRYIKLLEGVLEWQDEEERKKIITT